MKLFTCFLVLLAVTACGDAADMDNAGPSGLEATLAANDTWPYEAIGILDIVEAGYGDSNTPEWAVGSLVEDLEDFGVGIEIEGHVIARAGIDIDSGKRVRVWLEAPHDKYGVLTYPVSKIEAL